MFTLLGICLSLSTLLVFNSAATLMAALVWRVIRRSAETWSTANRMRVLFILSFAPGLAALLVVAGIILPAYLVHEPRQTSESITIELAILTVASAFGIGLACWRGAAAWLATQRLVRDWLSAASPIQIMDLDIPAFHFEHPFPVLAIVGVFRPRLFVAGQVLRSLSEEEIEAAVAHELGHLRAKDNFRRGFLRAWSSLCLIPLGRSLDHSWMEESEIAADEFAVGKDSRFALHLASALVKVARLVPRGCRPALPVGASFVTRAPGSIGARIRRLARFAEGEDIPAASGNAALISLVASLTGLAATIAIIRYRPDLLVTVHAAMENIVSLLQ